MTSVIIARGVSDAAQHIAETTKRNRSFLHKSSAVGHDRLLHGELVEVWEECRDPGWDGYKALPVSQDALLSMKSFLESLPLGFPLPTIAASPRGHLSVEWYRSPSRVLSVDVGSDNLLHYAALLGSSRTCGTEIFFDQIPDSILDLAGRVCS